MHSAMFLNIFLIFVLFFFLADKCVDSRKQYVKHDNSINNSYYRNDKQHEMSNRLYINKTVVLTILRNSSFYNLDYYDCSKYPEKDKNISRPNIYNNLLMIKSKFTRINHKKRKDIAFNVTTEGII